MLPHAPALQPRFVATLLVAGAVAALAAAGASAQTLGPGVREALDAEGSVRVFVALEPIPQTATAPQKQSAVSTVQGDMLERVRPDEFEVRHRFQAIPAMSGIVTREGLDALLSAPGVKRIDIDAPGSGELAESVPLIHADVLQQVYGLTGSGVTAAILDSGMDPAHPDLGNALVDEACFCSGGSGCCPGRVDSRVGPGSAVDDHFHGTHVTSILTGDGAVAPVGVAPGTKVVAVKVLDRNNRFCCSSDVVAGLDWIIANHPEVRILNMSLGTFQTFAGECDDATAFTMAFAEAIDTLTASGVSVFAASGNSGLEDRMPAPACVANTVSVGAVDKDSQIAAFSGSDTTLDLLAPGVAIIGARLGGGTRSVTGTSMAVPHAAGVAALLLEAHPGLSPARLRTVLKESGTPILDTRNGLAFPLVDAEAAFLSFERCDDGVDNDGDGLTDVEDPECPQVRIDIRPWLRFNAVRLVPWGRVRVALLGGETIDARNFDLSSLGFGPDEAPPHLYSRDPALLERLFLDVNRDGREDLILHFLVRETGIAAGDAEACLRGEIGGEVFRACDEVVTFCRRRDDWWSRLFGRHLPSYRQCRVLPGIGGASPPAGTARLRLASGGS